MVIFSLLEIFPSVQIFWYENDMWFDPQTTRNSTPQVNGAERENEGKTCWMRTSESAKAVDLCVNLRMVSGTNRNINIKAKHALTSTEICETGIWARDRMRRMHSSTKRRHRRSQKEGQSIEHTCSSKLCEITLAPPAFARKMYYPILQELLCGLVVKTLQENRKNSRSMFKWDLVSLGFFDTLVRLYMV